MKRNPVQRFREIVKVLAYYGFGFIVDSKLNKDHRSPANLRKAIEELGPTFIKIGQILSTRPDLLPVDYINELSKLQDRVPAERLEDISRVFHDEIHESLEDDFLYFDKEPIACASISQVHRAILRDGRHVIVKIQRPDIYEKMSLDLSILYKIANLTSAKFNDALIDPKEALNELMEATKLELDFTNEAKNIIKFKDLNKDVAFIYTPFIVPHLCTSRVITMEYIDGIKINDSSKLKAEGYDLEDIAKKLALSYFKQVLDDGFFHGDPHPGNLLIRDNKICYIDFGIMGCISKGTKSALFDMLIGIGYQDINKVSSAIMAIGIKKGYINRNQLYEDIEYLLNSYLSTSLENIKVSLALQEVFDCAKRNNLRVPKDLTLLMRGMVIIEGVVANIAPELKIIDVAIPYVRSSGKSSILKDLKFEEALLRSYVFIKDSFKLPSKLLELTDTITSGRLKLQMKHTNIDRPINELNKMVNRAIFAIITSSIIIGSSLIIRSNVGPKIYDISLIGIPGFIVAGIMGLWLLISIMKSGMM
ncbi:MAG: AarF/ABC1/UbiB kinase family protein [Bacillota bacterium]|nr:AarF/ABC1/UbiB kinase family protein [Bacillota bacterium]